MSEITQAIGTVTKNAETGAWDIVYGRPDDTHKAVMSGDFNMTEITKVVSHLTRLIGEADDDAYGRIITTLQDDPEVFRHLSNFRMAVFILDPARPSRSTGRLVRPSRPRRYR